MVKNFLAVALFCCASIILSAAEVTVAEWDFTKSSVLRNKFPVSLRGKSKVSKTGLDIPVGAPKDLAGARTQNIVPSLTPDGDFSVSADFTLSSKVQRKGQNHVILDNKYIPAPTAAQTNNHAGFILMLKHVKGNTFIPTASFGYGKVSKTVNGKPLAITFDKPHNITMTYDVKGNVKILLDKRPVVVGKAQPGVLAPAKLPLHFGDRAGADFWPLGGTIRKVTIKKIVIPPKKYNPGATIASWNFTDPNVVKSKYPVKMRGGSKSSPNGINVTAPGSGAVLEKPSADLTPQQGFELTVEASMNAGAQRTTPAMLVDMKYIPAGTADDHTGYMFFLEPTDRKRFRMIAAFGFGTHSNMVKSQEFIPAPGKVERYGMKFTANGQVFFYFNGKQISVASVPTGKVVHREKTATFGERSGKTYWPLGGNLKKVTIIAR